MTSGVLNYNVVCPTCQEVVSGWTNATPTENNSPSPGALTVCYACLEIGVFEEHADTGHLFLRVCTPEEKLDAAHNEPLMKAMVRFRWVKNVMAEIKAGRGPQQ